MDKKLKRERYDSVTSEGYMENIYAALTCTEMVPLSEEELEAAYAEAQHQLEDCWAMNREMSVMFQADTNVFQWHEYRSEFIPLRYQCGSKSGEEDAPDYTMLYGEIEGFSIEPYKDLYDHMHIALVATIDNNRVDRYERFKIYIAEVGDTKLARTKLHSIVEPDNSYNGQFEVGDEQRVEKWHDHVENLVDWFEMHDDVEITGEDFLDRIEAMAVSKRVNSLDEYVTALNLGVNGYDGLRLSASVSGIVSVLQPQTRATVKSHQISIHNDDMEVVAFDVKRVKGVIEGLMYCHNLTTGQGVAVPLRETFAVLSCHNLTVDADEMDS